MEIKPPKFNIGDKVFHVIPDSDAGIVIDCYYSLRFNIWTYRVAFAIDKEGLSYYENELTQNKQF